MRRDSLVLFALTGWLVACGSSGLRANHEAFVGRVLVMTSAQTGSAAGYDIFDVELQPFTPTTSPTSPCASATRVVGACCFYAPPPPQRTQPPGSGSPETELSAGTIRVLDATTGSAVGTFQPGKGNYKGLPANYAAGTWTPGDELTVSADGDEVGAFTITGRALEAAAATPPATVVRGQDLVVTWAPYANSDTMSVSLIDSLGAVVACTVPEAQGTVTIDASLFASFTAGPACQSTALREAKTYAQTSVGRVELESLSFASGFCTVH
jgi:hypothetical protein